MITHAETLKDLRADIFKTSQLHGLSKNIRKCGYVTPSGNFFECPVYGHFELLERLFLRGSYKDLFQEFRKWCSDNRVDPYLEYSTMYDVFALVELEWVKIAAYSPYRHGSLSEYDWQMVRVYDLTPQQTNFIFPIMNYAYKQ